MWNVGVGLPDGDADLQLGPSVAGGLADPSDLALDRRAGDVVEVQAAIGLRARVDADDVRLACGVGEQLGPAAADEERRMRSLDGPRQVGLVDGRVGVIGLMVDPAFAQGLAEHGERGAHAGQSLLWRVELQPGRLHLRAIPAGAQPNLQPATGHGVDRRQLLREHGRVPQLVVQDQGADAQVRHLRRRQEAGERCPGAQVVERQQDRCASRLGAARDLEHLVATANGSRNRHAKAERSLLRGRRWLGHARQSTRPSAVNGCARMHRIRGVPCPGRRGQPISCTPNTAAFHTITLRRNL